MAEKTHCNICNRTFKDADGLEQHNLAKHSELTGTEKAQIHSTPHTPIHSKKDAHGEILDKSSGKYLVYTGIGIIVIIALIFYFSSSGGGSGKYDAFAQCLNDKGAVMYGAFWCSHCAEQKKLFGASFKNVKYIECSTSDGKSQTQVCDAAGIQSYPTWKFGDGSVQGGVLSLQQLASKTECALESS